MVGVIAGQKNVWLDFSVFLGDSFRLQDFGVENNK
jgi:hypothetical protein